MALMAFLFLSFVHCGAYTGLNLGRDYEMGCNEGNKSLELQIHWIAQYY
jgi:hypothetical protein